MHIFSIFGRMYHINSETDMHIFSCLRCLYNINSQIYVYAFAPSRVLFKLFVSAVIIPMLNVVIILNFVIIYYIR